MDTASRTRFRPRSPRRWPRPGPSRCSTPRRCQAPTPIRRNGAPPSSTTSSPSSPTPSRLFRSSSRRTRGDEAPDLVLHDITSYPARVLAHRWGVPADLPLAESRRLGGVRGGGRRADVGRAQADRAGAGLLRALRGLAEGERDHPAPGSLRRPPRPLPRPDPQGAAAERRPGGRARPHLRRRLPGRPLRPGGLAAARRRREGGAGLARVRLHQAAGVLPASACGPSATCRAGTWCSRSAGTSTPASWATYRPTSKCVPGYRSWRC